MLKRFIAPFKRQAAQPEPPRRQRFRYSTLGEDLLTERPDAAGRDGAAAFNGASAGSPDETGKLMGHSYFKQNQFAEAALLFENVARQSRDAGDWFNLATSATLARQIEKGARAFERAVQLRAEAGSSQAPGIGLMRYYYAQALREAGELRRAWNQVEELRGTYAQLKNTDTAFLHRSGMPFLSHTMELALELHAALGPTVDIGAWFSDFAAGLDDDGRQYVEEVRASL